MKGGNEMNRLTYLLVLLWVPIFIQAQEVGPFGISKGAGSLQSVPGYYLDTTGTAQEKSGRLTLGELDLSTWTEDTNPDSVAVVNGGVVGYTAPATATALGWQNVTDSINENATWDSIYFGTIVIKMINDDSLCIYKNNVFKSRLDTLFY